jgi:hypothetical protein
MNYQENYMPQNPNKVFFAIVFVTMVLVYFAIKFEKDSNDNQVDFYTYHFALRNE